MQTPESFILTVATATVLIRVANTLGQALEDKREVKMKDNIPVEAKRPVSVKSTFRIWFTKFYGFNFDSYPDLWYNTFTGFLELSMYPYFIYAQKWEGIAVWLTFKTFVVYKRWEVDRLRVNRFVLFNAINIVVAFYFLEWPFKS